MAPEASFVGPNLSSFPPEILMLIAAFLPAQSVLPFALTSKDLYDASHDARRRQNFLYARYQLAVINCNLDPRYVDGRTSPDIDTSIVDIDMADAPLSLKVPLSPQNGGNSAVLTSNGGAFVAAAGGPTVLMAEGETPESHMPPNYFRSPITLLYHLRHNPDLTYHIREVHFQASNDATSSPLDARLWAELAASDIDGLLKDAAPWLGDSEGDREMWRQDIEGGNHGTALALLLSFLPNVREVALSGLLHTYSCWLDLLVRGVIKTPTHKPIKREHSSVHQTLMNRPLPLSKIISLHIEHIENDNFHGPPGQGPHGPPAQGPSGASLHSLLPLTLLPSIRKLTGRGIAGYDIFHAPVRAGIYKSQRTSPLHYIELQDSAISPSNLARFVRPMTELRRLTYEWGGAGVAGPSSVDMHVYRQEFLKEAKGWFNPDRFSVMVNDMEELEMVREHYLD